MIFVRVESWDAIKASSHRTSAPALDPTAHTGGEISKPVSRLSIVLLDDEAMALDAARKMRR